MIVSQLGKDQKIEESTLLHGKLAIKRAREANNMGDVGAVNSKEKRRESVMQKFTRPRDS